jgi:hypothetical protein
MTYAQVQRAFSDMSKLASDWQPMATAPKDSTVVILRSAGVGPSPEPFETVGRFGDGTWFEYPKNGLLVNLTHWKPLEDDVAATMKYRDFLIETYDTHHTGWRAKITRLDGRPIKTFPLGQEFPFIETMIFADADDALKEAKKLVDDGGMK